MKSGKSSKWERTNYCGQIRLSHKRQKVVLMGWVHKFRDIGNLVFIDMRDREGLIQVVISSDNPKLLEKAKKVRMEDVIGIEGQVLERKKQSKNPDMPTGEVEVEANKLEVLSESEVPPFVVTDPPKATEELRFKYRYLDMRRPSMQRNIKIRHKAALCIRNYLSAEDFLEIETPFLTKSTPEGARDYLIPSRIYKGKFYALPQSPQLFKQILMISGFDRYFQIVRCFRDEDLRADRQPEFTQIDIEMSFAKRKNIFKLCEEMMALVFNIIDAKIEFPFPCLTYKESMEKYGTDKPDLRCRSEIKDLTETGQKINSVILQKAFSSGGVLKSLVLEKGGDFSRSQLDQLNKKAQKLGCKGIIWIKRSGDGFSSSLKLKESELSLLWNAAKAKKNDLVLLIADKESVALKGLGGIRTEYICRQNENLDSFKFCWITDFPLFEKDEEENRLVAMHHPFTSPHEEDLDFLEKEPLAVRANSYDLVLNGYEIGGGSIRIHSLDLQKRIFNILGLNEQTTQKKFGFFLKALRYGTPPHGGIALGFDRIAMLLAGEKSIRDVIPFPKTTSALCLLTDSPSEASIKQLKELGLSLSNRRK
ncbi:MAG: aspartate--tRNA ligase [Candidatus Aminicenantaceae bacterium]